MVSMQYRMLWICLMISWSISATASEPNVAAQYLQPQAQWPALHPQAHADVAPLPAPLMTNKALAAIGEQLFNDPALSRDGSVSCGSCHKPTAHFADVTRISPGVEGREGRRTAQMLRLAGHWHTLFWDGRVNSLTALVEQPLTDPLEMDSSISHVMHYVRDHANYPKQLQAHFGEPLAWSHIALAMAEFMRAIEHPPRRFDHFMQAIEQEDFTAAANILSPEERHGLHLFRTTAGCVQCHAGPLFSDQQLHNIGLSYYGRSFEDLGHYKISGDPKHVGAFRTPSLRYVGERQHLMHNGLFDDLLGIVRMYRHGGARPKPRGEQVNDPLFPETSPLLKPFPLTREEEQALVKFLHTL